MSALAPVWLTGRPARSPGVDFLPFPLQRLTLADAKPEGKAGIIDAAQHAVGAELHLAIAAQRLGDRLKGGAIRHAIDGFRSWLPLGSAAGSDGSSRSRSSTPVPSSALKKPFSCSRKP